ncbi:MAG TPA: fluoride efflux transporter CrcB [Thermomicrobiales bacterium]|nr:fluoride efflux transporter CrcB [Thermomicrobiales bacterium]
MIAEDEATTEETRHASIADGWTGVVPTMLAIGIGGIIGANLRWKIGVWAADQWATPFPWGTLLINLTGSFVLGLYLTLVTERFTGRPLTRLMFATGLLGAYTTFSTFAYETVRLLQHGQIWTALAYVAASLALGLAACTGGIATGRAI